MKNRHGTLGFLTRKKVLLLLVVLLVLAGAAWWIFHPKNESAIDIARKKGDVTGQLDRENAKKHKQTSSDSSSSSGGGGSASGGNGSTENLKSVTPVLSRWSAETDPVQVAGYVQGIFEEGGTCTYVFTKDSTSFSRNSPGFQDATHTSCAPVDVSRGSFPQSGTWSVTLKYRSSTSSGTSNEQKFTLK